MLPAREAPVPYRTNRHSSISSVPITTCQQASPSSSGIMTAQEVATLLRISPRKVRELAEQWNDSGGTVGLRGKKVGPKLWRFQAQDVSEYMNS